MKSLGQAGMTRIMPQARREWLHLTPHLSGAPRVNLRVLSYNLLAPCYMHKRFFPHSRQEHLHWPARSKKIFNEIQRLNCPEVLSFQEYQKVYTESLKQSLGREGYRHIEGFKKRKQEGLAIFYKEDTFTCLWQGYLDLNLSRQLRPFPKFDFDTCALMCVLQNRQQPAQHLLVVNTHLLFSPLRGNEKLAQLVVVLKAIAKVMAAFPTLRMQVVFNGDFNFLPCSALYAFMSDGLFFPGQFQEQHYSAQLQNQHLPSGLTDAQHFIRSTRKVAPHPSNISSLAQPELYHNISRIQVELDHGLALKMGHAGCAAISYQDGAIINKLAFKSAYSVFHKEYARRKGLSAESVVNKYMGQLSNRQDMTWESQQTQLASTFRSTVDYIWTIDATPSSVYQALDYTPSFFPNEEYPSDHLALCTDLVFPL